MGERKVLNRYVPPDFDASLIPKFKRPKNNRLMEIRMMLPFSMCCNTCGEYLYAGTKFNSKKEDAVGEDYMGIKRFRFYIKCTVCNSEISFKTDPKNTDYEMESGATRNYELWRDVRDSKEEAAKEREEEDQFDAMKALENRTLDSKVEIDVLDALDEIKAINQRHERVDTNKVISILEKKRSSDTHNESSNSNNELSAADEALIKSIKFKSSNTSNNMSDDKSFTSLLQNQLKAKHSNSNNKAPVILKRKRIDSTNKAESSSSDVKVSTSSNTSDNANGSKASGMSMLASYGDDSD